ncbi:MAG TPA: hypothetical protein VGM88_09175 [Kofleriaceae bacterium]|jgi:hypothetical protein
MRHVIAVRGIGRRGKTTTIRGVLDLLRQAHPNAPPEGMVHTRDIAVIIVINGIKIGIESKGDPSTELRLRLQRLREAGCHIILCATRSRGETVDAVKSLRPIYNVEWIDKERSTATASQRQENAAMSQRIFERITTHLASLREPSAS